MKKGGRKMRMGKGELMGKDGEVEKVVKEMF